MNGMVVNSWPYVIAAYAVTWVVLLGYTVRLVRTTRRNATSSSSAGSNR